MHISEDQHANCLSRLCTPVLTSREGQDFPYRRRLSILHAMPNRAFCSISLWIFTTTPNPQRQESTSLSVTSNDLSTRRNPSSGPTRTATQTLRLTRKKNQFRTVLKFRPEPRRSLRSLKTYTQAILTYPA